jgi:hypothetical protein
MRLMLNLTRPLDRASWHDVWRETGVLIKINSATHRHSDGQPGTVRLYDQCYERSRAENGWYVF